MHVFILSLKKVYIGIIVSLWFEIVCAFEVAGGFECLPVFKEQNYLGPSLGGIPWDISARYSELTLMDVVAAAPS